MENLIYILLLAIIILLALIINVLIDVRKSIDVVNEFNILKLNRLINTIKKSHSKTFYDEKDKS